MPTRLVSERLILRPFSEADIGPAYEIFETHPEVYRFDPGFVRTRDQRAAIVRRHIEQNEEDGEGTLAIILKQSCQIIGQVGLQLYILPWQPFATAEVELYYKLGREYWGQGYAQEACRALIQFAFEKMNLLRLVTISHPDNHNSIRLLQRLGFIIAPGPERWIPHVVAVLVNPACRE